MNYQPPWEYQLFIDNKRIISMKLSVQELYYEIIKDTHMISTFRKQSKIVTLLVVLLFTVCTTLTVDQRTSFFIDQYDRYKFYKGVNVVYKEFPYYPPAKQFTSQDSLVQQDYQNLKAWGFNCIRLYIAWQGFEPVQGQFNYTYLGQIQRIVDQAESYGISVILDAHHDLYSKRYCGQGFPTWATPVHNFPFPINVKLRYDSEGNPLKQDCVKKPFWQFYISQDVNRFQHQFFKNKDGILDKFIAMWVAVASYFKGQANIIGYQIINQPIGGNGYQNFYEVMGPGVGNNKYLLPFYKKISREIRKIDQTKLFIFEPSMVDEFGGFYESPSQQKFKRLDVLSYHTYCPLINKHAEPQNQRVCAALNQWYVSHRVSNIKKLKIGGMMTQFGDVLETEKGVRQITRNVGFFQQHWQSWFYWQYKRNADSTSLTNPPWEQSLYYPNGTVQIKKVRVLSHPYAYALCGQPIKQNHNDLSYQLAFVSRKCGKKNTEIFINEQLYFASGFNVVFEGCQQCRLRYISKSYYEVIIPEEKVGKIIKLTIVGYI